MQVDKQTLISQSANHSEQLEFCPTAAPFTMHFLDRFVTFLCGSSHHSNPTWHGSLSKLGQTHIEIDGRNYSDTQISETDRQVSVRLLSYGARHPTMLPLVVVC